jgi:hypothetical protein
MKEGHTHLILRPCFLSLQRMPLDPKSSSLRGESMLSLEIWAKRSPSPCLEVARLPSKMFLDSREFIVLHLEVKHCL